MNEIELMEIEDVAKYLHVTTKCIYNQIYSYKKGKKGIPPNLYKKIGNRTIFIKSKVIEWVLSE